MKNDLTNSEYHIINKRKKGSRRYIPRLWMDLAKNHFRVSESTIRMRLLAGIPEYLTFFSNLMDEYKESVSKKEEQLKENKKAARKLVAEMRNHRYLVS